MTAYISARAPFARPILRSLRRTLLAAPAGLEETIKWGMPAYVHRGKLVCGFAGFKAHCALWFWKGTSLVGAKPKGAMGHFGRITDLAGLPSAREVHGYVAKVVERIDGKS